MEIGEATSTRSVMKQTCDCGDEGCKGHTFPKDQYQRLEKSWFVRLHIKDRLWFLFWGSVAVGFMQFAVLLSDKSSSPFDNYLIGFVAGIVVTGVFFLRFDDEN